MDKMGNYNSHREEFEKLEKLSFGKKDINFGYIFGDRDDEIQNHHTHEDGLYDETLESVQLV
jgi:hypothetical protein